MTNNKMLNYKIKWMIAQYAENMSFGSESIVMGNTHMEIENGEDIRGYYYLHGTESTVGDFYYSGTINKDNDGGIYADMNFMWNDKLDPNPVYSTDRTKAMIAEIITLGRAQPYEVHIYWEQEFNIGN